MLNFYSVWNMSWFVLRYSSPEKIKHVLSKADKALYISLLNTALFGGFMAYIYPRKLRYKLAGKVYQIEFGLRFMFIDLFTHQIPLLIGHFQQKLYLTGSSFYVYPVMGAYRLFIYKYHNNKHPYNLSEKYAYCIPICFGVYEIFSKNQHKVLL